MIDIGDLDGRARSLQCRAAGGRSGRTRSRTKHTHERKIVKADVLDQRSEREIDVPVDATRSPSSSLVPVFDFRKSRRRSKENSIVAHSALYRYGVHERDPAFPPLLDARTAYQHAQNHRIECLDDFITSKRLPANLELSKIRNYRENDQNSVIIEN